MAEHGRGTVRVRPAIRRMVRIVVPVLAVIAAWQLWDNLEARRLGVELAPVMAASDVGAGNVPPRDGGDEAARYYAAAAVAVEEVRRRPRPWRSCARPSCAAQRHLKPSWPRRRLSWRQTSGPSGSSIKGAGFRFAASTHPRVSASVISVSFCCAAWRPTGRWT